MIRWLDKNVGRFVWLGLLIVSFIAISSSYFGQMEFQSPPLNFASDTAIVTTHKVSGFCSGDYITILPPEFVVRDEVVKSLTRVVYWSETESETVFEIERQTAVHLGPGEIKPNTITERIPDLPPGNYTRYSLIEAKSSGDDNLFLSVYSVDIQISNCEGD